MDEPHARMLALGALSLTPNASNLIELQAHAPADQQDYRLYSPRRPRFHDLPLLDGRLARAALPVGEEPGLPRALGVAEVGRLAAAELAWRVARAEAAR